MNTREPGYDPIELTYKIEKEVVLGNARRYYRFRPARFYGGIATGDVVGCNLRCVFCWTRIPRDNLRVGSFYTPQEAWNRLRSIAEQHGYRFLRLSGGEPTIGFQHLVELLELVEADGRYTFILETNGILLGAHPEYVRKLAQFTCVHVRVSIKACSEEMFHKVTGAKPSSFQYQLLALKHLADYGVSHHPAIVLGFGDENCYKTLVEKIKEVDPDAVEHLEPEVIVLYPHVEKRLKAAGIWPRLAYTPSGKLVKAKEKG